MEREQLLKELKNRGLTSLAVNRIEKLMSHFGSIQEFLEAKRGDLMAMYIKDHPGTKHGLSNKTFLAIDQAVAIYKQHQLEAVNTAKEEAAAHERQKQEEIKANPRFRLQEIKALASLMELCGIEEIDLKGIYDLFRNMKVSISVNDNKQ